MDFVVGIGVGVGLAVLIDFIVGSFPNRRSALRTAVARRLADRTDNPRPSTPRNSHD